MCYKVVEFRYLKYLRLNIHKFYVFRHQDSRIFCCIPKQFFRAVLHIMMEKNTLESVSPSCLGILGLCDAKSEKSMQFSTKEMREISSTALSSIMRLLAAVSPNKNPSPNNREQNVSFDRGTPGPGWRFQETFQLASLLFSGSYTMCF